MPGEIQCSYDTRSKSSNRTLSAGSIGQAENCITEGGYAVRYRITETGFGRLNEQERLELSRLLIKAGYAVKQGREKPSPKATAYKCESRVK